MRATRLLICAAFTMGAASALIIEHVGLMSPWRTMGFVAVSATIAWFGRLTFEDQDA